MSIIGRVSSILLEGRSHASRYLAYSAVNQWLANLSIEERQALRTYSYMGMRINRLIAEQAKDGGSLDGLFLCPDTPLKVVLNRLDSAIAKCKTRARITVFRGVPAKILHLYDDLIGGEVISIPTYISATENEKTAIGYSGSLTPSSYRTTKQLRIYMRILIPANSCAAPLGAGPFEVWSNLHEVVLPRNSQFAVKTSAEDSSGLKRLDLELA